MLLLLPLLLTMMKKGMLEADQKLEGFDSGMEKSELERRLGGGKVFFSMGDLFLSPNL